MSLPLSTRSGGRYRRYHSLVAFPFSPHPQGATSLQYVVRCSEQRVTISLERLMVWIQPIAVRTRFVSPMLRSVAVLCLLLGQAVATPQTVGTTRPDDGRAARGGDLTPQQLAARYPFPLTTCDNVSSKSLCFLLEL